MKIKNRKCKKELYKKQKKKINKWNRKNKKEMI